MTLKRFFVIISCLVLLPLLSGCGSTKKKDQEVTGIGRLYTNTTARFNGFFNAEELIKSSIASLEQTYLEDFTDVLPIYPYQSIGDASSVSGSLDAAIEKATVVVALRRKGDWTDDCYLLVGKAQFLKQDYESAEETLRFMLAEYGEEDLELQRIRRQNQKKNKTPKTKSSGNQSKKSTASTKTEEEIQAEISKEEKKKQEEKAREQRKKELDKWRKKYNRAVRARRKGKNVPLPKRPGSEEDKKEEEKVAAIDSVALAKKEEPKVETPPPPPPPKKDDDRKYFLYRKPAWQEAKLWMARTLLERDKKEEAIRYIRQLNGDGNTFREVRREVPVLEAYIRMEEENYPEAANALVRAIPLQNEKAKKARYTFILGQLYGVEGKYTQAYNAFKDVLGLTNDFEMEFNSRLNMALCNFKGGAESKTEIVADLEKMLKEDKNFEYRDQIYYTLAQLALERGDRTAAIYNLQQSLNTSRQNRAQKASSYLTLADLYFEDENYVPAKNYYDSTLMVLPIGDEDYDRAKLLATNLSAIAEAITTIAFQDSLLEISRLSEADKRKLAYQIQQERDEARLKEASVQGTSTSNLNAIRRPTGNTGNEPVFFAYDDRLLKRGERDFNRRWGDRPLEDNWRRSQRRGAELFESEEQVEEAVPETVFSDEAIDDILQDVPGTPEEIADTELKIQDAYYALGSLYRDNLEYFEKSTEALETMLQRFPNSSLKLDAWYLIYLNCLELKDNSCANAYKSRIISSFPESSYAKVLQDPGYAQELLEKESEINRAYAKAYVFYEMDNVTEVHRMCVEAANKFDPKHPLQAKFALLDAFALGKFEGEEAYKQALQKVSTGYPDTDEARQAREMLRLLGGAVAALPGGQEIDMTQFKAEKNAVHYVLVSINAPDMDINIVTRIINEFNNQFFQAARLRVANIYLGPDPSSRKPIIVVRRFRNEADALAYYDAYLENKDQFIGGNDYDVLPISQNNYRQVLRNKTVEGYKDFFQQMYVK